MEPLVSILIPCYNAEKWVGQAIESALGQTWPNKEMIVVDDGSIDRSLEVIRGFGDKIKWETGPNRGGNVARNRLLELSQGEWIQYLDADDYLRPEKIADQLRDTTTNSADIIYSRLIQESLINDQISHDVALAPPSQDPWCLLVQWELPQTGAVLMRRHALEEVGGWKIDQPCCQEHELYLRLLCAGKSFRYSSAYGAVYRQWPKGSVSRRNTPEVLRQRLEITRRAEEFLRNESELTPERLSKDRFATINQAKLEVARSLWKYDRAFALSIVNEIRQCEPGFRPGAVGSRVSYGWAYRMIYRFLGFDAAEKLARLARKKTQA
jgi:glycosyltransferase involved in cell wall biosynthesis